MTGQMKVNCKTIVNVVQAEKEQEWFIYIKRPKYVGC